MQIHIFKKQTGNFKNNSSKPLLESLAQHNNWGEIRYTQGGKPLSTFGHLSVTHAHDILIIAHSVHPIGIDLEKYRPLQANLIKKLDLNPKWPILSWCQKEAMIKLYDDKTYLFKQIEQEHCLEIDIHEHYCFVVVSNQAIPAYEIIEHHID